MNYEFLAESYETERVKVLSVRSECRDEDLPVGPMPNDPRGRSVHEQMVHQCVSEDARFRTILEIDVSVVDGRRNGRDRLPPRRPAGRG